MSSMIIRWFPSSSLSYILKRKLISLPKYLKPRTSPKCSYWYDTEYIVVDIQIRLLYIVTRTRRLSWVFYTSFNPLKARMITYAQRIGLVDFFVSACRAFLSLSYLQIFSCNLLAFFLCPFLLSFSCFWQIVIIINQNGCNECGDNDSRITAFGLSYGNAINCSNLKHQ